MTRLSVLICTYNRHEMLQKSLDALIERTSEKPDEVIVVNGGNERADRVVASFVGRKDVEVKLVKTINKNLAASRNVGLPHCTGDIIAMTDDDAEVFPDWVGQMKRIHREHPEAGAVGGKVIGVNVSEKFLDRIADAATFPSLTNAAYVRTLPGVNISYKRTVISETGVQDESLFRGEDVDYNWRLRKNGYRVYYDPCITVLHHHRPTLCKLTTQHYMYGRAYFLVRCKWKEMYSILPLTLTTKRDLKRLSLFIASFVIDPITMSARMERLVDRLISLPTMILIHTAWKLGIIYQFFFGYKENGRQ